VLLVNSGRFVKGGIRSFKRICDSCSKEFIATSGHRKRCSECCKCHECGKQLPNASHRFCGNSCAGKYKFRTSIKVRQAIEMGLHEAHKRLSARTHALKGQARPHMRGPLNPNWNGGGCRDKRHTEMGRVEYVSWRTSVFERDDFTCLICKKRGGKLEAHHIKTWSSNPELRYTVSNGATLCSGCHKKVNHNELEFEGHFAKSLSQAA
jgi:5-methylcytosine-specific restriction endonuclease McrA